MLSKGVVASDRQFVLRGNLSSDQDRGCVIGIHSVALSTVVENRSLDGSAAVAVPLSKLRLGVSCCFSIADLAAFQGVPLEDIPTFVDRNPQAKECVKNVHAACESVGFFYLVRAEKKRDDS